MKKEMIPTIENNYITTINEILTDNRISFRKIDYRNGTLYLCRTPFGQTFNLRLKNNQSIKIWSFVGSVPVKNINVRYVYKKPADSSSTVGIEITDEGDISFYVLQTLDLKHDKSRIRSLIESYSKVISNTVFQAAKV